MLILLVVLLFFGSKSIPDLARGLGKGLREIREASESIRSEIEHAANAPKNVEEVEKEKVQEKESKKTEEQKKQSSEEQNLPLDQQF